MTDTTNRNPPDHSTGPRKPPTHVAKQLVERGGVHSFERIGSAWSRDDGSFFVKLHGTQIISGGFTLYAVEEGGAR